MSLSFYEKIVHPILSNNFYTIFIFAATGVIISKSFDINFGGDAWFYFFSTIAQSFAAIVALLAVFSISRFEYYRSQIIIHTEELAKFVFDYDDDLHIMESRINGNKITKRIHRDKLFERVDNFISSTPRNQGTNSKMEYIRNEIEILRNLIINFKQKENRMKILMSSSLINTSKIVALSVLLLPFGKWSSTNFWLLKSLEFPWLKLGFNF